MLNNGGGHGGYSSDMSARGHGHGGYSSDITARGRVSLTVVMVHTALK